MLARSAGRCAVCARRALSTSAAAAPGSTSRAATAKAKDKPRTLPDSPAAPFSLQPHVVEAAFANARRRKAYPAEPEAVRDVLRQAREALPSMANEIAKLKRELSRDPRKLGTAPSSEHTGADARELKEKLRALIAQHDELQAAALRARQQFPNSTHSEVPEGPESKARVIAFADPSRLLPPELAAALQERIPCALGELPTAASSSEGTAHTDLAASLPHALFPSSSALDLASGALTTGASFPFLLGPIAALSHALETYALRVCVAHGFLPVRAPDIIKTKLAQRCGFMPRDEGEAAQTYFVSTAHSDGEDHALCLAGTAEIPLAGLCADREFVLAGSKSGGQGKPSLPLKLCALGGAFRVEAGARGKDTKGLYRVHQFDKVEMFVVAPPKVADGSTGSATNVDPFLADDADMSYLEELRAIQEEIVGRLGLPYRVLDMPTEELGATACRKYDIEVWMPGRGSWGEISSASHCSEFQARRLNIRYRASPSSLGGSALAKLEYAHTLNATAAAVPRLIVALLENYGLDHGDGAPATSQAETVGSSSRTPRLRLPDVLRPYWIGLQDEVNWVSVPEVRSHLGKSNE